MEVLPLQNQYPYTERFNVTSVAPPSNITVAATTEAAVSVDTSRNDDVKGRQNVHRCESSHVHLTIPYSIRITSLNSFGAQKILLC